MQKIVINRSFVTIYKSTKKKVHRHKGLKTNLTITVLVNYSW